MIKKQLINQTYHSLTNNDELPKNTIRDLSQLSRKDLGYILDELLSQIKKALRNDDSVLLTNFGKFYTQIRKGRKVSNPRTREIMYIDPVNVVKFKPSNRLKKEVRH